MAQQLMVEPFGAPLYVSPDVHHDDVALFEFSAAHPEWRVERTSSGALVLMTPVGGETGRRNALITAALTVWAEAEGSGIAFDSSTGFRLPNGAVRSPDAAWVAHHLLSALTADEKRRFLPLCPDFVIELRSASDDLLTLQAKMEEYRTNGARLGWLIDPGNQQVYRYEGKQPVELLDAPDTISANPLLKGFTLSLGSIWNPGF